ADCVEWSAQCFATVRFFRFSVVRQSIRAVPTRSASASQWYAWQSNPTEARNPPFPTRFAWSDNRGSTLQKESRSTPARELAHSHFPDQTTLHWYCFLEVP